MRADSARLEILAIVGMVAGTARPSELTTWNSAVGEELVLDPAADRRTGGAAGPALRLLRLVLQLPVCGNQ